MAERAPIGKRMRFEVLKRDSFTCQYCGKQPPDTVLHIDHITPVSKGGKNTILNLITSCSDCNLGKSDIELSDDSAIKKQQRQLSDLAEKKIQIQMMIKWRESLLHADDLLTESAVELINKYLSEWTLNKQGVAAVRKAIKKKGYQLVIDAIEKCYCNSISSQDFREKYGKAIEFAGSNQRPTLSYAKGILRNRGINISDKSFHSEFDASVLDGNEINKLIETAKICNNLNDFREAYAGVLNG